MNLHDIRGLGQNFGFWYDVGDGNWFFPLARLEGEVCWNLFLAASPLLGGCMSKTKRKNPRREFETNPLERHTVKRRCDSCNLWFPEDEVYEDIPDGRGHRGYFCGGCI